MGLKAPFPSDRLSCYDTDMRKRTLNTAQQHLWSVLNPDTVTETARHTEAPDRQHDPSGREGDRIAPCGESDTDVVSTDDSAPSSD